MDLEKFSIGVGDRFALQAKAQLRACMLALEQGVTVVPVWNKSKREHGIIGSTPAQTRAAADAAVDELGWTQPYHVDADHIRLQTVDEFLAEADFFTMDVADEIGRAVPGEMVEAFAGRHPELHGEIEVAGMGGPLEISMHQLRAAAAKYLAATAEAGRIYRHIAGVKAADQFITEVSMDETDAPQGPAELLIILAALADEGIPVQTIAPKFTGRFNKGVDYRGDAAQFEREFNADLAVLGVAVKTYGLPASLKLSLHSGSDKFSLYPVIRRALRRTGSGLHLKTAGTTWLEELIGLSDGGGEGPAVVREIYVQALKRMDELCGPYANVIDIDRARLPSAAEAMRWDGEQFASALRHDVTNAKFNGNLRQLLHVGYKVAAEMGCRFLEAVEAQAERIGRGVTANLYERHIRPVFVDGGSP